jgi:ferredoxin
MVLTMRISVELERCESQGLRVLAAPDVFRMDDNGNLDYDATPAPCDADAVGDAAVSCPSAAFRIEAS